MIALGRWVIVLACLLTITLVLPSSGLAKRDGGGGPSALSAPATVAAGGDYEIVTSFRTGSPMVVDLGPAATAPASAVARLVMVMSPTEVTEVTLGQKLKAPARDVVLHVLVADDAPVGTSLQFAITAGGQSYVTGTTQIEAP